MILNLQLHQDAERMSYIDQTRLPTEYIFITTEDYKQVAEDIKRLAIRGAPAIGVSAAMAVAMAIRHEKITDIEQLMKRTYEICDYFAATRPTAVNLFWALDKMRKVVNKVDFSKINVGQYKKVLEQSAQDIANEDITTNKTMAAYAASLIKDGEKILTLCNDGVLCSVAYGTAGGAFVTAAKEEGKNIHVYVAETRPLLQGIRLTAWELQQEGIPYTVMTDSMMGYAFENQKISMVMLGADRITANGDTANKIGTYTASVIAKAYGVPFYVVAPSSTFDLNMQTGCEMIIEQRAAEEITTFNGLRIAPEGANVLNPAFDITPGNNVTAIITEKGIFYPPYNSNTLSKNANK